MQCYRDEPAVDANGNIIKFTANDNKCNSFKFKQQIIEKIGNGGTKDVEVLVPLKNIVNFCRRLEIYLINCEISLQFICSKKRILAPGTAAKKKVTKFRITNTKFLL